MSKTEYITFKLIGANILLIVLMIYSYPRAIESEIVTGGGVTTLYGLGIILIVISAVLICLRMLRKTISVVLWFLKRLRKNN